MKHACNDTRGDRPLPVGELRRRRFEGAVIFSTFSQSALPAALLCYMAQIPLRLAACRENPYRLLTDWVAETEPDNGIRHEVRRQLDLVGAIGCGTADETLSLAVPAAAKAEAAALLEHRGLAPGGTWLVVHPGATAPPGATPLKNSRARPMK
jgi:ADP-heptose:LPS heptosyltransferase